MDFSTTASSQCYGSFFSAPAATEPQAEDSTVGDLGFAADTGDRLMTRVAQAENAVANWAQPIADDLNQGSSELGETLQRGIGNLRSTAETAETAAKDLGHLGKGLGALDAIGGAVSTYNHSDAKTQAGKLADGALGAGSKILAGAAWPLAAADFATHGELSNLYHAGGKALAAGAQAAMAGSFEPMQEFNAASARGDYGKVSQTVTKTGFYLKDELIPNTIKGIESWF